MQHISKTLSDYQGLSMHQFNHIKKNNIKNWQIVGDLSDEQHDFLQYTNEQGKEITILSTGEVYQDNL